MLGLPQLPCNFLPHGCNQRGIGCGSNVTAAAQSCRYEGFYSYTATPQELAANPPVDPGNPAWPMKAGQDFMRNHEHPGIDFATTHM